MNYLCRRDGLNYIGSMQVGGWIVVGSKIGELPIEDRTRLIYNNENRWRLNFISFRLRCDGFVKDFIHDPLLQNEVLL